jgi:hypothetical protein
MLTITSRVALAALVSLGLFGCELPDLRRASSDDAGRAEASDSTADGNQAKDSSAKPPRRFQLGGDNYPLYSD